MPVKYKQKQEKRKKEKEMKLIKKIAAIMFAFMMVFSLSTNVNAESGKYEDRDGKITISNAVVGQTYTIYRM